MSYQPAGTLGPSRFGQDGHRTQTVSVVQEGHAPARDEQTAGRLDDAAAVRLGDLSRLFAALANRNRLELLLQLRRPRRLADIRLHPTPSRAGDRPDRAISRQAVQNHIDLLMDRGLVRLRVHRMPGHRLSQEYEADFAKLFTLREKLRGFLSTPPASSESIQTQPLDTLPPEDWATRHKPPRLVTAGGLRRGQTFPLRTSHLANGRGWIIGRSDKAHIHLPHDPYAGKENAEILLDRNRFQLMDMRNCRNRTTHNGRPLDAGAVVPLRSGDLVGVGRTLLVFQGDPHA